MGSQSGPALARISTSSKLQRETLRGHPNDSSYPVPMGIAGYRRKRDMKEFATSVGLGASAVSVCKSVSRVGELMHEPVVAHPIQHVVGGRQEPGNCTLLNLYQR